MLAGLPAGFIATLPDARNASEQVLCDLVSLNDAALIQEDLAPLRHWLSNAIALSEFRPEADLFRRALSHDQGLSTRRSEAPCPLTFSVVRLDAAETNWVERPLADTPEWSDPRRTDPGSPPFGEPYSHFFALARYMEGADIVFDLVLQNRSSEPLILSHIGVQIIALHEDLGCDALLVMAAADDRIAIPRAAPILISQCYELALPELRDNSAARALLGGRVQREVRLLLPDPIYFQSAAPYRFTLKLRHYQEHIPVDSVCAFVARSDRGDARSPFVRLRTTHTWMTYAERALQMEHLEQWSAAQREAERRKLAPWIDAMPSCLAPYWDDMNVGQPDLARLGEVLEAAYPEPTTRALALFRWLGASNGAWNGAPQHELVPELLLLEYPTSTLAEALATTTLTREHLQGAVRYFAVWRPSYHVKYADLKTLPAEIKAVLLQHSQGAGYDSTKLAMAIRAFSC